MASILKSISWQLTAVSVCALATTLPAVAAPNVVASIAPIHSIAAAIMKDVGSPHLLVPPSASPHSTDLRPSGARALQEADLVFWVGPDIEGFLAKPLESLSSDAKTITLIKANDITLLPIREGGDWERHSHDHGDHDDHDHEGHDHEGHEHEGHEEGHEGHEHEGHEHEGHEHEGHDHEGHKHEGHEHEGDEHEHHDHGGMDSHIWLSPDNGVAIAAAMTHVLSEIDPENAKTYKANLVNFKGELDAAVKESTDLLKDFRSAPFIVFHDAYQYFETGFDLSAIGSITLHPRR